MIKRFIAVIAISGCLYSCKDQTPDGKFEVSGEIKNIPDQQIFLEHISFNQNSPEVLDTAEVKNGKFNLSATAAEEGLYHLRLQNAETDFIFINDQPVITLKADAKKQDINGHSFYSPSNGVLQKLLLSLDSFSRVMKASGERIDSLKNSDSALQQETAKREDTRNQYKNYIIHFINTATDPIVVMLALGYTQNIDPVLLSPSIAGLGKRFPGHKGIESIVKEYNEYFAKLKEPKPAKPSVPATGSQAPDFTMNDPEGNPFSLSQLKGKYVLLDFWASWCGPCRAENPNVVAAYNKFSIKNFTVLGVSLDEDKNKWINAVNEDKLVWKQISDLKQWNSMAVGLYGFEGIPYNVLIDPEGKIIATELRGSALDQKLEEVLK